MRTKKNKDFEKAMEDYCTFMLGGEDLSPELKKELEEYDRKRSEKQAEKK